MKEDINKMDRESLCHAIIDGINIFCREVLIPKEYLSVKNWNDKKLLSEKYKVAEEVSERWID